MLIRFARIFCISATLVSLLSFVPGTFYWEEIIRSARLYFVVAFGVAVPFVVINRAKFSSRFLRIVVPLMLLVLAEGVNTHYRYFWPRAVPVDGHQYRLFFANVNTQRGDLSALQSLVTEANPDFVGLLEVDQRWIEQLNLGAAYPFKVEIPRNDNFGIAFYSRFAFQGDPVVSLGETHEHIPPIVMADVVLPSNQRLAMALLHTLPPTSRAHFRLSELLVRRVGVKLRHSTNPFVVAGDLNSGPDGSHYRRFLKTTQADNAAWGFGLARTWNALNPLLYFTIDHVLVRGGVTPQNFTVGHAFGSDHLPIIFDFSL